MSDESPDTTTTNDEGADASGTPDEEVEMDAASVTTDPEAEMADPTPTDESRDTLQTLVESGVIDPDDIDEDKLYGDRGDSREADVNPRKKQQGQEALAEVQRKREEYEREQEQQQQDEPDDLSVVGLNDAGEESRQERRDSGTSASASGSSSASFEGEGEYDLSEFEDQDLDSLTERAPKDVLTVRRDTRFLIQEPDPDDPDVDANVDDVMQNMQQTLRRLANRNPDDLDMDEVYDEMYPLIDLFIVAPTFSREQWNEFQAGVRRAIGEGVFEYIDSEVSGFTLGRSERRLLGQG